MQRSKRLGRDFKGKPRVGQRFEAPLSRNRQSSKILVDSDNPGDWKTKKSTVGQAAFVDNHVVKHACNLFQNIGLSSAENEYFAISCTSLGLQSLLLDWGVDTSVRVASASSAATRFTSRQGLGSKMEQIQSKNLCISELLALGLRNWTLLQAKTIAVTYSQRSCDMQRHMKAMNNNSVKDGRLQQSLCCLVGGTAHGNVVEIDGFDQNYAEVLKSENDDDEIIVNLARRREKTQSKSTSDRERDRFLTEPVEGYVEACRIVE